MFKSEPHKNHLRRSLKKTTSLPKSDWERDLASVSLEEILNPTPKAWGDETWEVSIPRPGWWPKIWSRLWGSQCKLEAHLESPLSVLFLLQP